MTHALRAAASAGSAFPLHRCNHDADADAFGLVDSEQRVPALPPVAARPDLKERAVVAAGKKAGLASPAAAERTTGYTVGGISPPGGRKRLPTSFDAGGLVQATVFVSAGQRGLERGLSPQDLLRPTAATVASLTDS